jgi:hypothetical protein
VLKKTKKFTDATGRNIAGMQGNQFGQAVQQQYSSFAENGTECMKKGEYPMYVVVEICLLMKMVESIKLRWGELEAVSHNPYSEGSSIYG